MFYTYILQNSTGHYYIGQTSDIDDRVHRHNSGRSRYTRGRGPWTLVYHEQFDTRKEACHREREIKGWKSTTRIRELVNAG